MAKTIDKKKNEYLITYESDEHFEVLGYVKAYSLEEATKKAQKELLDEAKHYKVTKAEINEISQYRSISFDIH